LTTNICISEAFELYRLEYIVYLNQSKKTEEMSVCAMKALIEYVGDISMQELTFDKVRKWKEHLERTRGQNTVRGYIIKLRVVLKHLYLAGYKDIIHYEMVGVPKRLSKVVAFITPEEVEQLIDAAFQPCVGSDPLRRYRNRALISLLYASGIRVSEVCSLDIAQLRMDDMTFTVIGKGNKPRLCFFDERSKYYIQSYLALRKDRCRALFMSPLTGNRISKSTVQMMFRFTSHRAGLEKEVHPHTMRHSFATNMLRNNTNLLYVSKFLGHASIQTTEMYTHVVNEDLRSIYREKHSV